MFEKDVMKNIEKETAKNLEKNLYGWYPSEKGTHEERMEGFWKTFDKFVFPPMTDGLKVKIEDYIIFRNEIFVATLISTIDSE